MSVGRKGAFVATALLALVALGLPGARDVRGDIVTGSWRDRAGACVLVLERYDGPSYRMRIQGAEARAWEACTPSFADLAAALRRLFAAAAPPGTVSLYVGTVADVPGLAAELVAAARTSTAWDAAAGRPLSGDTNGFVAGLLRESPLLRELFAGYAIAGVSVEKVLVPTRRAIRERRPGDAVPDARLPYDAQLWVRLSANPP